MPPPEIKTSFLSVRPFEPVLVFKDASEAGSFRTRCPQGRILPDQRSYWVFLPMPTGLLRVRTARDGDVAYEFDTHDHAQRFNEVILRLGTISSATREQPLKDRIVYVGRRIR